MPAWRLCTKYISSLLPLSLVKSTLMTLLQSRIGNGERIRKRAASCLISRQRRQGTWFAQKNRIRSLLLICILAIAWKLSKEDHVEAIFVAPGNGGTAHGLRKVKNVDSVPADDFPGLVTFARENKVNLVIPGPEAPLVAGIERFFRAGELWGFLISFSIRSSATFPHCVHLLQYRNLQ